MFSLLIKKKLKDTSNRNAGQERVANCIESVCIRLQQRWAHFMQRQTERLSPSEKLIILSLFCLTTASLSLYLIASSVSGRREYSFTVTHLKRSPFAGMSGNENIKAIGIVTKAEYEKIHRFGIYMDSLARSTSGKKHYDSILTKSPGLMDSVILVENIYQSQIKK